jgi:hypothetical protein
VFINQGLNVFIATARNIWCRVWLPLPPYFCLDLALIGIQYFLKVRVRTIKSITCHWKSPMLLLPGHANWLFLTLHQHFWISQSHVQCWLSGWINWQAWSTRPQAKSCLLFSHKRFGLVWVSWEESYCLDVELWLNAVVFLWWWRDERGSCP